MKKILLLTVGLTLLLAPALFAADPVVARAIFTTAIENREPVDELTVAGTGLTTIYFFTELRNFDGQQVTHRWLYNDQVMAEIPFNVKGPRWRVYSSKKFIPEWTGTWQVQVIAGDGSVTAATALEYKMGEGAMTTRPVAPPAATTMAAEVARVQFTSAIADREPTDDLATTDTALAQLFFFSEIRGMAGQQITHRWIFKDQVMAEVPFTIGGPRWRVYSSKTMSPSWIGKWRVDVVDADGKTLATEVVERMVK